VSDLEVNSVFRNYQEVIEKAKKLGRVTVSVAVAHDKEAIGAIKLAASEGLVKAFLVGDADQIHDMANELSLTSNIEVFHEPDPDKAALAATALVSSGKAHVLMKGQCNTSNFMRAALNPNCGLRAGKVLFHLAGFQIPGEKKLAFHVDGGVNIAPTLAQKREILIQTIEVLRSIGYEKPNVAVLTANEQVNPKMPATVDAKALVDMAAAGEFPPCVIEGPIAMDVAASAEAAKHKGIDSKIAGDVDIFLVPFIEAGNFVGKTLVHYAKARIGGVILGGTHPIVMVSRSDTADDKLYSIALACLVAHENTAVRSLTPVCAASNG
jgi:phosphate butyryltransferase